MAKTCEVCNKNIGFLESSVKLRSTHLKCIVCEECGSSIAEEITRLASVTSTDEREQAIEEYTSSGVYNASVMECINYMAHQEAIDNEVKIELNVVVGKDILNMRKSDKYVTMHQDSEGYIYFDSLPDYYFTLNGYNWEGPVYKTVTTANGHSVTKRKGKARTKRKGGLGGALVGTMLLPGVGTAIGYAATSKKVSGYKGKDRTNTTAVVTENQVEVNGTATIHLKNAYDGTTFSIGIMCNSKIDIDLDRFDWSAAYPTDEKEELELESVKVNNESERITLLKQYKELLDSGIITQEDFDMKKEELLN